MRTARLQDDDGPGLLRLDVLDRLRQRGEPSARQLDRLGRFGRWARHGAGPPSITAINWTHQLDDAALADCPDPCPTCEDAITPRPRTSWKRPSRPPSTRARPSASSRPRARAASPTPCSNSSALAGASIRSNGAPVTPTRYAAASPVTVRSTFKMPNFEGQLKAYDSTGDGRVGRRAEAEDERAQRHGHGTTLELRRASRRLERRRRPSFRAATAKIRRRIFTTSRNGVSPANADPLAADHRLTPAWPRATPRPTRPVRWTARPRYGTGLGIGGLTFAQLQSAVPRLRRQP